MSTAFWEGVKNCKLFEKLATSYGNLAATNIATRNPHAAKNSTFYEFINVDKKRAKRIEWPMWQFLSVHP